LFLPRVLGSFIALLLFLLRPSFVMGDEDASVRSPSSLRSPCRTRPLSRFFLRRSRPEKKEKDKPKTLNYLNLPVRPHCTQLSHTVNPRKNILQPKNIFSTP
jgi:hypothetical protein